MSRLQAELERVGQWFVNLRKDGPDLTINAHKKTAHEAVELEAEPSLEELADVAICLVGVCVHQGWTMDDVAEAVRAKLAVNEDRTWYQKEDGTWQHVKHV